MSRVTIEIFGDYQCSSCRGLNDLLTKTIIPHHKNQLEVLYHFYPLPQHPWAAVAAEIGACVRDRDPSLFPVITNFFYDQQDRLSVASVVDEASKLLSKRGFAASELQSCLDSHALGDQLEADRKLGANLGVNSTPTVFVNGERIFGVINESVLENAIAKATSTQQDRSTAKETL